MKKICREVLQIDPELFRLSVSWGTVPSIIQYTVDNYSYSILNYTILYILSCTALLCSLDCTRLRSFVRMYGHDMWQIIDQPGKVAMDQLMCASLFPRPTNCMKKAYAIHKMSEAFV